MPCMIPTGKKIAPAMRNPQAPVVKQTYRCVNQANKSANPIDSSATKNTKRSGADFRLRIAALLKMSDISNSPSVDIQHK